MNKENTSALHDKCSEGFGQVILTRIKDKPATPGEQTNTVLTHLKHEKIEVQGKPILLHHIEFTCIIIFTSCK